MISLEITKRDLDSSITVNSITMGSGTDIFCYFIFRLKKDFLQIVSSNGRAGVLSSIVLPEDEEREELFAVEAWRIKAWISASNSEVVTLVYDKGTLTLKDDIGSVSFPCTSAGLFPFWDDNFESIKETSYRVSSAFLKKAFTYVKGFVAEDAESERPDIAVAESAEGVLAATNALVLSSVSSKIFEDLKVRVHGKDFSTLMKFLSSCKGTPVEVYPSEKGLFLEREDGTQFSLARPAIAMKQLVVADNRDAFVTVNTKTMELAMKSLASAMSRGDDKIHFCVEKSHLVLSDGTDKNSMRIPCVLEETKPLPEEGFWFTYPYFQKILALYDKEEVKIGIVSYLKEGQLQGGMLCVKDEDEDAKYSSDLVWRV